MSPRSRKKEIRRTTHAHHVGRVVRDLRMRRRISARELSGLVGIDPRQLNAIEKGRIQNPSLDCLGRLASALGIGLAELVSLHETQKPGHFELGHAAGSFSMEFRRKGFKLVSYTPPIREMFCGKMVIRRKREIDRTAFRLSVLIFIQVIMGRLLVKYQNREQLLRPGATLLLNGRYPFQFTNLSLRDTSFLFFTTPAPWNEAFFQRSSAA